MTLSELRKIAGDARDKYDYPSEAKFDVTFYPALALELIGLIEDARDTLELYTQRKGGLSARSFLSTLRKWEEHE